MSPRNRDSSGVPGDIESAPFVDDDERAEARWLLARETDPGAAAPSEGVAREYERLEGLLGDLPPGAVDDSWHDAVLKAAARRAAPPRRRRSIYRWAIGSAVAAAAAIAVLLFVRRPPDLEVTTWHGDAVRSAGEVALHDHVLVEAHPRGGSGELRVFDASGALVARCPGGPSCRSTSGDHHVIEFTVEKLSPYQVILVVGDGAARLPEGAMGDYLKAVRAAGGHVVQDRLINPR